MLVTISSCLTVTRWCFQNKQYASRAKVNLKFGDIYTKGQRKTVTNAFASAAATGLEVTGIIYTISGWPD